MFDLRSMSSVAPMVDLLTSIGLVFGAIFMANLLVVHALAGKDRGAARQLLLWSGFALLGTVAVLALRPSSFFLAVFGYLLIFAISGGVLGWQRLRSIRVIRRVVGASLLLGVAVAASVTLVYMPR
jgi:hypothetical protein